MKKKLLNLLKRYWVIVCVTTIAVLFAIGMSLAAYTSFNSVKRVVSTGKASNTLFSSNYLSLVSKDITETTAYPTRQISPSETDGNCVFTVQVCNYVYGNTTAWNTRDINYAFTVEVLPRSGGSLPEGVAGITVRKDNNSAVYSGNGTFGFSETHTLSKNSASMNTYTITVPSNLKDQIKLVIVAAPDATSESATNRQKLAENIILSTPEPTKNWTGKFIDSKGNAPSDYDAFNYEISGNGAGTVTLKWNSTVLQASKWFTDAHLPITDSTENGVLYKSISFEVGASDVAPTAYQLQFYRVPGEPKLEGKGWEKPNGLEGYVTVEFTPKNETQSAG